MRRTICDHPIGTRVTHIRRISTMMHSTHRRAPHRQTRSTNPAVAARLSDDKDGRARRRSSASTVTTASLPLHKATGAVKPHTDGKRHLLRQSAQKRHLRLFESGSSRFDGPQNLTRRSAGRTRLRPHSRLTEICNEGSSRKQGRKSAPLRHREKGPFICPHRKCTQVFATADGLNTHKRAHAAERLFVCLWEGCEQQFGSRSDRDRRRHEVMHHRKKIHDCPFEGCAKSFLRKQDRLKHLRIHTGDKPYPCTFADCEKRFTTASARIRHGSVHGGLRPFVCPYELCGKTHARKEHLRRHLLAHGMQCPRSSARVRAYATNAGPDTHLQQHQKPDRDQLPGIDASPAEHSPPAMRSPPSPQAVHSPQVIDTPQAITAPDSQALPNRESATWSSSSDARPPTGPEPTGIWPMATQPPGQSTVYDGYPMPAPGPNLQLGLWHYCLPDAGLRQGGWPGYHSSTWRGYHSSAWPGYHSSVWPGYHSSAWRGYAAPFTLTEQPASTYNFYPAGYPSIDRLPPAPRLPRPLAEAWHACPPALPPVTTQFYDNLTTETERSWNSAAFH